MRLQIVTRFFWNAITWDVRCPTACAMSWPQVVERGDSDDLVLQAFVQKYGPTVLLATTARFQPGSMGDAVSRTGFGLSHGGADRAVVEEPSAGAAGRRGCSGERHGTGAFS